MKEKQTLFKMSWLVSLRNGFFVNRKYCKDDQIIHTCDLCLGGSIVQQGRQFPIPADEVRRIGGKRQFAQMGSPLREDDQAEHSPCQGAAKICYGWRATGNILSNL
jgi:hypothetical protein